MYKRRLRWIKSKMVEIRGVIDMEEAHKQRRAVAHQMAPLNLAPTVS